VYPDRSPVMGVHRQGLVHVRYRQLQLGYLQRTLHRRLDDMPGVQVFINQYALERR
jgi:hypothetical protein